MKNKETKNTKSIIGDVTAYRRPAWFHYRYRDNKPKIEHCGKWMLFFSRNSYEFAKEICVKAIQEEVVSACKHTSIEEDSVNKYSSIIAICFYIDGSQGNDHKRVIKFLIANDLIRKTKSGKLFNISFKFDTQTLSGEYGKDFNSTIKLKDFVDLETHEFIK